MYNKIALASLSFLAAARGQQVGTLAAETHPTMNMATCVAGGTCTTQNTKIVLDANWRWLHSTANYTNCYTGNTWNTALCPDPVTCASNCAIDGADYSGTYGITASGTSLTLKFVTKGSYGTNIGSRVYLLASDTAYQTFKLKGQEFTFDVDVSNLPCGLNGALYFTQMDADGGMAAHPANKAGAKYGTGYCDAQCPHDMKFINGEANLLDWTPSTNDANAGSGRYGTCCTEMDIWEANLNAAAYTPHVCTGNGLTRCEGTTCGDGTARYSGICDKDGCDFNSYRQGNTSFLGTGKIIDTSKVFTVVTQFITSDGSAGGTLTEIKRFYVQGGKVIPNSVSNIQGIDAVNSITDSFCAQQKTAFGDTNMFKAKGGMAGFSTALDTPMVLSLSIWDDHTADMNWLDSTYPVGSTKLGAARGACDPAAGVPATVESAHPGASVTFSNIKFGPINSTYSATGTTTGGSAGGGTTGGGTTGGGSTGTVPKWGQCGGQGYTGSTTCAAGSTCQASSIYYSQCL